MRIIFIHAAVKGDKIAFAQNLPVQAQTVERVKCLILLKARIKYRNLHRPSTVAFIVKELTLVDMNLGIGGSVIE